MTDILKKNWNNIKNTWKGVKSLIFCKNCSIQYTIPTAHSLDNGNTRTSPYDIANTFNNYFASIAETTKRSIKYSHKHFSDYLSNESDSTIFLQPTDKGEIVNILSSLNSSKASDPNGVNTLHNIISSKNRNFKAIGRFIQTLFHDWCFSFCTQKCNSSSCF